MNYIFIFIVFYPILLVFSIFRNKKNQNIVIQTAKIGDYVNSTVLLNKLKTDILIDKINYEFTLNEPNIDKVFIINDYKKNLFSKLKLVFRLFWNNYENIYILMPNSFNLFLAKMVFTKNTYTISTYSTKWYEKILMIGMKKINHTKDDLTIKSYLKLINESDIQKNWKKLPINQPNQNLINSNKFKIGISLSAGNKMKTIDFDTWKEIFEILEKFECEYYIFGLENEQVYLDNIKSLNLKNPISSLLGKIELKHLAFYISQMNLYISSDTGNSYIADTFKIPIINFAGPCYMPEQRPLNKNTLIINSHAKCVPFSFIFKAPYKALCDNLYKTDEKDKKTIEDFVTKIYKDFQFHKYNYLY